MGRGAPMNPAKLPASSSAVMAPHEAPENHTELGRAAATAPHQAREDRTDLRRAAAKPAHNTPKDRGPLP